MKAFGRLVEILFLFFRNPDDLLTSRLGQLPQECLTRLELLDQVEELNQNQHLLLKFQYN